MIPDTSAQEIFGLSGNGDNQPDCTDLQLDVDQCRHMMTLYHCRQTCKQPMLATPRAKQYPGLIHAITPAVSPFMFRHVLHGSSVLLQVGSQIGMIMHWVYHLCQHQG